MAVKPIPDGYNTITPYLMVKDASKFIDFMSSVFGAITEVQLTRPDGKLGHCEMRLGNSMVMLSEAEPSHPPTPVMLHVYVHDVDAAYLRAIKAGGVEVSKPADQFYGDRSGGVKEPCGNTIWIATHIQDVPPHELMHRTAAAVEKK